LAGMLPMPQKADALLAAEKEPGAKGLLEKIELEIQKRARQGIAEGVPDLQSEAQQLISLKQLSGMLEPRLGGMLQKLLTHWDESSGVEEKLADVMKANEELKKRCEALEAAAASGGGAGTPEA
jgi:hypothetical protein